MNIANPSPSDSGLTAPTELEVLAAESQASPASERLVGQIRAVRDADVQLARRLQMMLSLGGNDLAALQHIRQENEARRPVRASQLGGVIGVTSAASTMLVNRLVCNGHLTREPDRKDPKRIGHHPRIPE
jgi:predicted phage gp36 major capsid-like protein